MNKKSIPELDKLFMEIGTYSKSSEFRELFNFVKKFPHVAPYNAMLIHIQKPGSEFVATADEWERRFNRSIKPGARPLVILRPFGPVAFVFELGDTEGKDPFPKELLNPFRADGKLPDSAFNNLVNSLKGEGILYREVDYGSSMAGFIRLSGCDWEDRIIRRNKEIWIKILYEMIVNSNHEQETKFATILHELGHLYCGHLKKRGSKNLNDPSKNTQEFEAECVCWLVCERIGIKNPSAEYLSGYLDKNESIPPVSIDAILKSTGIIESMIRGDREPRKDIIIRTNLLNHNLI